MSSVDRFNVHGLGGHFGVLNEEFAPIRSFEYDDLFRGFIRFNHGLGNGYAEIASHAMEGEIGQAAVGGKSADKEISVAWFVADHDYVLAGVKCVETACDTKICTAEGCIHIIA